MKTKADISKNGEIIRLSSGSNNVAGIIVRIGKENHKAMVPFTGIAYYYEQDETSSVIKLIDSTKYM